jgi:hypothetical protein
MNLLLIDIAACFFIGVMGRNRKMGFWGYFFGSLLLTPVIGLLLVLASDDRTKNAPAALQPKIVTDSEVTPK